LNKCLREAKERTPPHAYRQEAIGKEVRSQIFTTNIRKMMSAPLYE